MTLLMNLIKDWAAHGTYKLHRGQIAMHDSEISPDIRKVVDEHQRRMDCAYGGVLLALFMREHPWVDQIKLYLTTSMTPAVVNVGDLVLVPGADVPPELVDGNADSSTRAKAHLEHWWADHAGDMHRALAEDAFDDVTVILPRWAFAACLQDDEIDGLAVFNALSAAARRGVSQ